MFRRTTISTPILLVIVLVLLSLPSKPVAAAQADQATPTINLSALKRELLECYNGAVPPEMAFCAIQPIIANDDTTVTLEIRFEGRIRREIAQQLVNAPAGTRAGILRLGEVGVLPGDNYQMRVSDGSQNRDFLKGFRPDPTTRMQILPPVDLTVAQLAPAQISGTVSELDSKQALADQEVKLYTGDVLLGSSTTITRTGGTAPTFIFDPGTLPNEQPLRLETTYQDIDYSVDFQWLGQPIDVSFILGWACGDDITSRRGGGTGSLPPLFCLTTIANDDNKPVEGAQIYIEAGGQVFGPLTTASSENIATPMAAAEIGAAMYAGGDTGMVRVIAVTDDKVGITVRTAEQLGLGTRWGAQVDVTLQSDVVAALGLSGGLPGPIARNGNMTMVGSWGGMLTQTSEGAPWLRTWLHQTPLLAPPEVTALFADENRRMAGFSDGRVVSSLDGGENWTTLIGPGTRPVRGITVYSDTIYLVRGSQLWRVTPDNTINQIDTITFTPTALRVLPDGSLVAGSANGVRHWINESTWQTIGNHNVTALATLEFAGQPWLLIGSETGLYLLDLAGNERQLADVPVLGIDATNSGTEWEITFTTLDGIRRGRLASASDTPNFPLLVGGNDLQAAAAANITTNLPNPDVYDLVVTNDLIAAATATGVYTSTDNALNFNATNPTLTGVVRSIALLNGELLALQPDALRRLRNSTWEALDTLPSPLNGMVVRTSGELIVVGRDAGSGASLYLSSDGGTSWSAVDLGLNRGVADIAALNDSANQLRFAVATNGDGLYGVSWNGSSFQISQMPTLNDTNGVAARISAVQFISVNNSCRLLTGTFGVDAGLAERPCDTTSAWTTTLLSLSANGLNVGAVRAFLQLDKNRLLAATGSGFMLGDPNNIAGSWSLSNFGVPTRSSTLALPPDFDTMRRYLSGGGQSGVLLLSDVAPDLAVRVDLETVSNPVRGNTVITPTVIFRNQGLLPTAAAAYTITIETAQTTALTTNPIVITGTVAELLSSQVYSVPVTIAVGFDTRPGDLRLSVDAPQSEQFDSNNRADAVIKLDYRDGPDLRPFISGSLQLDPNERGILLLRVLNLGTLPSDVATVSLPIPAGMTVTPPISATLSGNLLTWPVAALPVDGEVTLPISYTISGTPPTTTGWPLTTSLTTPGDDRELLNNSDSVTVTLRPTDPQGVIVINPSRQEKLGLGPVNLLRPLIGEIARTEKLLILDLSSEPVCVDDPKSIACLYDTLDAAQAEVSEAAPDEQRDAEMPDLLADTISERKALVKAIQVRIAAMLPEDLEEPVVYLIGGDAIIPMDAALDISANEKTLGQSVTPEKANAGTIEPQDSLYSVFLANYYPHYAAYQRIDGRITRFGVQVGDAAVIAPAMQAFIDSQGNLDIYRALVSGIAEDLTKDTQTWLCYLFKAYSLPVWPVNCEDIDPSAAAGLSKFQQNLLAVISGHATATQIEDLTSTKIAAEDIDDLNMLLILLGCHSGLSPNPTMGEVRSLVESLNAQGIPTFGFSGFAYAQEDQATITNDSAYAEQLVRYLTRGLVKADGESLGALFNAARLAYGQHNLNGDQVGLHRKTLDTLILYGPPMYRVRSIGSQPRPLMTTEAWLNARPLPPPPPQTLSITPEYDVQQLPEGVIYLAKLSAAESLVLIEMGHTIQPAIIYTLPNNITGALIDGGLINSVGITDPVVPRIAPLQSGSDYSEPAPFENSGWAFMPRMRVDENGRIVLVMPVGSWNPQTAEQSLVSSIDLELTEPVDVNAPPPQLPAEPVLCMLGPELNITLDDGTAIERVEAVSIDENGLVVYPLRLTGNTWRGRVPIPAGVQLFLQALGTNGSTIFITDGAQPYTAPGKLPPCRPT